MRTARTTGAGGTGQRPDGRREDWGLSGLDLAVVSFALIGGTTVLTLPALAASYAGQGAGIATLVPLPLGWLPLWLLFDLDRRRPGLTLVEQARASLGPVAGSVVAVLAVIFLATGMPVVVRQFTDVISFEALPLTPPVVVVGLLLLPSLYAARRGIETIARLGTLLLPPAILALLFILLATARRVEVLNLLPPTGSGWTGIGQAASIAASFYLETMLLGFVLPFRGHGSTRRSLWLGAVAGLGLAGLLSALIAEWNVGVFGASAPAQTTAALELTRVGGIPSLLEHLDALVIVAWVASGFVKMAVGLFALCLALAQTLGLRDYRPLTLPAAVAVAVATLSWFESGTQLSDWVARVSLFWSAGFALGLPLAVWIGAVVRDRRSGRARGDAPRSPSR